MSQSTFAYSTDPGCVRRDSPVTALTPAGRFTGRRSHLLHEESMPLVRSISVRTLTLAMITLASLAAGCGGKDASDGIDSAVGDTTATAEAPAAATPPASGDAPAPLEVADIDRWQRGMQGELEAVRKAGESLRSAKTGTDSANAIFAANEMSTRGAGATAAGVDEERYQRIRTTLSPIVAQMSPLELEMNVAQMPASMVEQMKKGRAEALASAIAELPPALIKALEPRAADLRRQDLALVAERLRAAGMAH